MPRIGTSGSEQAAGAAAPWTGSSGDKWRPDATDWIIWGRSSSRSRSTLYRIIQGQGAARRPRPDNPGWIRQQEPPPPGLDRRGTRGGQTPRTGSSGAEQEGTATTQGAGKIWPAAQSTRRGPYPPGRSVRGSVAARGEGNRRPRPRWCRQRVQAGSNAKDNAKDMQRGREGDEAEETQGRKDEEGAVEKQRNRP